jgi:hypothetical protein
LRLAASLAALAALLPVAVTAARHAPVRVLLSAPVAPAARDSMSPALWERLVIAYVSADVVPFAHDPTLDDCRAAKAAYMVDAPFELRPRLPGMVNASGRVAARTHLVVTNCVTGDVTYDQVILLDSDPPSGASAGDFESVPEISWEKVVPQELARYPVFFPRVARIKSVDPPFAYIDLGGTNPLQIGDVLRAFAGANGEKRAPVFLTVTSTDTKLVQVLFADNPGDPIPQKGDYVEPVPKPAQIPAAPTPLPSPTRSKHR